MRCKVVVNRFDVQFNAYIDIMVTFPLNMYAQMCAFSQSQLIDLLCKYIVCLCMSFEQKKTICNAALYHRNASKLLLFRMICVNASVFFFNRTELNYADSNFSTYYVVHLLAYIFWLLHCVCFIHRIHVFWTRCPCAKTSTLVQKKNLK